MLGLRLDEPVALDVEGVEAVVDAKAVERLRRAGLVDEAAERGLRLTARGRMLGGAVTAEILA
jgi:Mn-dependent DtxR family transcriptional regulator